MSGKTCCASCAQASNGLPIPTVPDALPPLPGDDAWLVPVEFQGQPLRVEIAAWDGYEEDNETTGYLLVSLYINDDQLVDTIQLDPPFDVDADFPLRYAVPEVLFNHPGLATFHYRLSSDSGNFVDSLPTRIEIDHRAPNGNNPGAALIFPDDVVDEGLTPERLAKYGDKLPVEVPRWPDMAIGDRVDFYWGTPFDGEPVDSLEITALHVVPGTPIEFAYSGDILRAKGNGEHHGYYVLSDRSGNRNPRSAIVLIRVIDLPSVPDGFPAPVVPLASTDQLIDLEDARTGVVVEIGPISGTAAGDILETWWNSRPLPSITLPAEPAWPLTVAVDWAILSADGFAAPVPGNVQYRWRRGAAPGEDSPVTRFTVDLTVAGPDPEDPDPINPKLDLLVVKGLTGDNVLVGPDIENDAVVALELYDNPRDGELLELHWGDHPQVAATYRVQANDQPGQQVRFTVPWTIIESVGNDPQLPIFYWVSNGTNRQRSRNTLVRVAVRPLEGLEPVSFPDATLWGWINCEAEPWKGIRVKIPGDAALLEAGDLIEMSWQLCRDQVGQEPITEPVIFPPHELSAIEAADGVVLLMNRFVELVLPLGAEDGSANVGYRLSKLDGTPGVAPNKLLRISLGRPDGSICDGTR